LIIGVDGGQHFEPRQIAHDERRRAYLADRGYRVLRFSNLDVMKNKSGVLETIAGALGPSKSPLPNPPPQAGEGTEGPMTVARAGTSGALRPAPSPACGGGVGRGCVPPVPRQGSGRRRDFLAACVSETIAAAFERSKSPLPNPPPQAGEGTERLTS
jgi:hypothetical protein